MNLVSLQDVTFFYPGKKHPVLDEIDLSLDSGEFVLLIGPSGCGKTTLLQTIAGVTPHSTGGRIRGKVLIEGTDILRSSNERRGVVGLVLQDPEAQLTNLYVEDEVAFGPENLCLPKEEVLARVKEVSGHARIEDLRHRFVYTLSGGQKQRVAIAGGLAMRPRVLLMDGPTTNLDPQGADEVLQLINRLRAGDTEAVLIASNKIDALLPLATRLIVMSEGRIILEGTPEQVILGNIDLLRELGLFVPELGSIIAEFKQRGIELSLPRTVTQAAEILAPLGLKTPCLSEKSNSNTTEPIVKIESICFGYDEKQVLHDLSLTINKGEFLAVVGQNGSGKTTLMKLIAGLRKSLSGKISVCGEDTRIKSPLGRVGYVFQYPEHQFVTPTVEEELQFGLELLGLSPEEVARRVKEMLELFGLEEKRGNPPYILSMGEKRRLSVATMLSLEPEILILDEPTTGLDRNDTENLMALLNRLVQEQSITVIQVSHDMEQVAEFATRVIVLDNGKIVFDGTPRTLFLNEAILASCKLGAPPVAELAKQLWPGCQNIPITIKEVLRCLC